MLPSWKRRFDDPIELPKGKKLVTLRDAALYITKLPKAEHDTVEWQAAMEALLASCRQRRPNDAGADRNDEGAAAA